MELLIVVHNMELTTRIQDHVEKKVGKLDRYMPNLTEVRVDLTAQKTRSAGQRQVAQITARDNRGTILRAEERSSDMFAAIDTVVDKLYRQIKRYRGKWLQKRRVGAGHDALAELAALEPLPGNEFDALIDDDDESDEAPRIVRRKTFELMPMSAEEAIEQMELLGHDFYVFFNTEEEAINVVYRRQDEDYGLLLPEMA